MTLEAQRIAIAEACGWTVCKEEGYEDRGWYPDTPEYGKKTDTTYFTRLPGYFTDLNAMHEAERALTKEQRDEWVAFMNANFFCRGDHWPDKMHELFDLAHATAAQRAEAFLRTLNLWQGTK